MSRIIKTSEKILLNTPEVDFITPLIKLNNIPAINNANIQYLTRNSGTGNLEVVNLLPTLYNANGTLTGNRTVSAGVSDNLTFTGFFGTFSINTWSNVVIDGITISSNSSSTSSFNSTNTIFLGTTTPVVNLSATTRTLNINSTTTRMSNISFRPGGIIAGGQFVFVDTATKNLRCENLPTAFGCAKLNSTVGGITLTSVTPIDVSGANLNINPIGMSFSFVNTAGSGLQYNISVFTSTFPVTTFKIELSGFYSATVNQDYSVGILINGVLNTDTVKTLSYPAGVTNADFSIKPITLNLNNGDEIRMALGRSTSDANIDIDANLVVTPISYYYS